jgi:hypothetical protein
MKGGIVLARRMPHTQRPLQPFQRTSSVRQRTQFVHLYKGENIATDRNPRITRPTGRVRDNFGTGNGTDKNSIAINVYGPWDDGTGKSPPGPPSCIPLPPPAPLSKT